LPLALFRPLHPLTLRGSHRLFRRRAAYFLRLISVIRIGDLSIWRALRMTNSQVCSVKHRERAPLDVLLPLRPGVYSKAILDTGKEAFVCLGAKTLCQRAGVVTTLCQEVGPISL